MEVMAERSGLAVNLLSRKINVLYPKPSWCVTALPRHRRSAIRAMQLGIAEKGTHDPEMFCLFRAKGSDVITMKGQQGLRG